MGNIIPMLAVAIDLSINNFVPYTTATARIRAPSLSVRAILLKNNQFVRLVSVSFEEIWCTPILPQEKIFNLNVMPPFHIRSYYSRKPDRVSLSYAGSPAGELTFDFTSVGQDEYEITPSGILNVNLPVEMDSGQVFLQVEYNRLTRQNKPFAKDASLKVFNPRISFETLGKTQYHLAERVALVWNSTQLFERKVDLFLFEEGKPDPVWSSSNPLTAQTLEFELSEALGLKSGVNYYFRIRGSAEYNRVITAESGRFTVEVPGQLPSLEYFGFENQAPGLAGWEYTDTVPVIANGKITIRLEPWFYENDRCRIFFNATNYDQAILSWIQGGGSQSMPVVSQEEVERRDFTKFVLNGPVAGTKAEFQIEMIPVHYTPDKTTYVIFGTDNTILIKVRTNSTRIPKLLASGFGEYTGTVQHDSVGRYLAYTIPDARVAKPRVALKFTEAGMADMPYDLGVITITIPSIAFVYNSNWGQKDPVLKKYLLPAMNDFMLDFTTLSVDTVAVSIVKGDTVVSLLAGKWPVADGNNQFRVTAGSLAALQTDSVYRFQIEDAAGRAEKALSESFLVTRSLQDPFGRGDRHMRIIAAGGNGLAAIPDPDFFSGPVSITVTSLSGIVLGFGSVNPGEPFTIVQNCWDSGGQLLIIRCADKTGHVSVVKTFSKQ